MQRKPPFKATGRNDVWFVVFCLAAVLVAALIPRHEDAGASDRPQPAAAAPIKD